MKLEKQKFAVPLLSSALIVALLSTSAFASTDGDYDATCVSAKGKIGIQTQAECTKAIAAKNVKEVEKTKAVIFGVTTGVLVGMAFAPPFPGKGTVCGVLNIGTSAVGTIMDGKAETTNSQYVGNFAAVAGQAAPLLALKDAAKFKSVLTDGNFKGLIDAADTKAVAGVTADGSDAVAASNAQRNSCLLSAASTGLQTALSVIGTTKANSVYKSTVDTAMNLHESGSANGFAMNLSNAPGGIDAVAGKVAAIANQTDCSTQSGDAYLKCVGSMSPEVSAITGNTKLTDALSAATGGKSLGDLAKNYQGESSKDLANYVGAAIGTNGPALGTSMNLSEKFAKDSGAVDKYNPLTYSAGASKVASVGADLDFGKLMGDMMKQLNPDGTAKASDPTDLAFRQLDLLPPEKIEGNKNISLFARVGYRYQKKSSEVEKLNYSRPENQSAPSRLPASN